MSDDAPQKQLLEGMAQAFQRFQKNGELAAIEDRFEWEELVRSQAPEERELLCELVRFVDLWRYLQEREERLGPEILAAISQLPQLPVPERIARLKEINYRLMERVGDAGQCAQLRQ